MLVKENTIKAREITFITYSGNGEIIVTTPSREGDTYKAFFSYPSDREVDEYERTEHFDESVTIVADLNVRWG